MGIQPASSPPRSAADDVLRIWSDYRRTGDVELRNRLVLTFAPMVKYIVFRKARALPAHCEIEDFVSCGLEALIAAIERYDPSKGATLEQYAWTRVHGAVLDELRRQDWAPRSLRRQERDVERASAQHLALCGRRPSRPELAAALGLSEAALRKHQDDVALSDVGSLNSLVAGEDDAAIERIDTLVSTDDRLDPERAAATNMAKERFRLAFDTLPTRDREIAVLLYVENMALREVGLVLGVSESRVCQLHAQLKRRLRARLGAGAPAPVA